MLCYRGRTFCPFHEVCYKGGVCDRAATNELRRNADAYNIGLCLYTDPPDCFECKINMEHKGFWGSIKLDFERTLWYGKILNPIDNDLVTYEADGLDDLREEFKKAVDDYIQTCREL